MKKYIKPSTDVLNIEVSPILAASPVLVDPTDNNDIDRSKDNILGSFDVWGMDEED